MIKKIQKLKREKNAIILAHNYQPPEIQDVADFVGDSLELSQKATETKADIIIFCGVYFMAETAKLLSPDKKVILPDAEAGCRMADMIDIQKLQHLKNEHPKAIVVAYVNSTAEIKAMSDICCTSANALKIIGSIPKNKQIIFVPDKYLGNYIKEQTGRDIILFEGFCPTHIKIIAPDIIRLKNEHPKALVILHPECRTDVLKFANKITSTGGMLKFVKESRFKEFIIGTEIGIIHHLQKENPNKIFYPATELAICPNMKKITLEKLLNSLEKEEFEIKIPKDIAKKAKLAIDKMFSVN